MPSNAIRAKAFEAIAPRAAAFSSALALTAAQLRDWIDEHGAPDGAFGAFAIGRIDAGRLARVLAPPKPLDAAWGEPLERALRVLEELLGRGDDLFRVRVAAGGDLAAAVGHALADAGRAFGAARLAGLARSSHYRPEEHDLLVEGFPFGRWSTAERRLAPPLLIEVEGGDAVVAGLGAYLDGNQAFVLIVSGDSPPAPLARLVSPGVLVVQAGADDEAFARVSGVEGPAVMAIMPPSAPSFVHLPTTGRGPGGIEVSKMPLQEPRRPVGSLSVFQQQQDLRLLAAMAAPNSAPVHLNGHSNGNANSNGNGIGAVPDAVGSTVDLAGALADWLLARVDLSDLEAVE